MISNKSKKFGTTLDVPQHIHQDQNFRIENSLGSNSSGETELSIHSSEWPEETIENKLRYSGNLFKWTNFMHGWQERYFILNNGVLSYYRNSSEEDNNCRGSLKLRHAFIYPNYSDDASFEVRLSDCIWYLRGRNKFERDHWIEALQIQRRHMLTESGYGSEQNLNLIHNNSIKNSSNTGFSSNKNDLNTKHTNGLRSSMSMRSQESDSYTGNAFGLREKLAELETFKEILCQQLDTLQTYFENCSYVIKQDSIEENTSFSLVDDHDAILKHDLMTRNDINGEGHWMQMSSEQVSNNVSDIVEKNQRVLEYVSQLPSLNNSESNIETNRLQLESGSIFTFNDDHFDLDSSTQLHKSSSSSSDIYPSNISEDYATPRATTPKQQLVSNANSSSFLVRTGMGLISKLLSSSKINQTSEDNSQRGINKKEGDTPESVPYQDIRKVLLLHGSQAPDFKGQAYTFKATAAGILTNLGLFIEKITDMENEWRLSLSKEQQQRMRVEEALKSARDEISSLRIQTIPIEPLKQTNNVSGHRRVLSASIPQSMYSNSQVVLAQPRLATGTAERVQVAYPQAPIEKNSPLLEKEEMLLREEEFFDAIDAHFDKLQKDPKMKEEEEALLEALKTVGNQLETAPRNLSHDHVLYDFLEISVNDRIRLFKAAPKISDMENIAARTGSCKDNWQIILQEGAMTVYNYEMETTDGLVHDPLQAVHTVENVTAKEMCNIFWDVRYRLDWEITIDEPPTVIEVCSEDTLYKRVWPAAQRDALMCSHIRPLDINILDLDISSSYDSNERVIDAWLVSNMSTTYGEDKITSFPTTLIRLGIDVVLVCQTVIELHPDEIWDEEFKKSITNLPRDRFKCRLFYAAQINPGGWAPAVVLRQLARREYPRFLKRFSSFVQEHTKNLKPIFS